MKDMINEKRNHHFISQTEQVLHARSDDVSAKRINRFEVQDKKRLKLKKTTRKGISIANNLLFKDLYCFDFLSRLEQYNFEETFGAYESRYNNLIKRIIYLEDDLSNTYLDLFTYKWMNILRNPFCIKNTLSMFGEFLKMAPADKELQKIYKRIDSGVKPQEKRVCEYFGVTNEEYTSWLKILFLVLSVRHGDLNTLELFTRSMFNDKKSHLNIFLFTVEKEFTVFSDVGFTSITNKTHLSYEFPLTSSHYISYGFTDLDTFAKQIEIEQDWDISKGIKLINNQPKSVNVKKLNNDLDCLKSFNERMIQQSRKFVFSKSKKPFCS